MLEIDGNKYNTLASEFTQCNKNYSTLNVLDKLGHYDRIISLITELAGRLACQSAVFGSITHGGYIPLNCSNIKTCFLLDCDQPLPHNKYTFLTDLDIINPAFVRRSILHVETYIPNTYDQFVRTNSPIIISNIDIQLASDYASDYTCYVLSDTKTIVCIPSWAHPLFLCEFAVFLTHNILNYDNLINLCVMVKNGGDEFVSMLETNLPFIDRWTILDTGSTDDTVANVRRIMAGKQGNLYQEPFINFGKSRNRCLELAGHECTYNLMLDDTYQLKGDIRSFLQYIRGDQFADSFSLYITHTDIAYASNRIFKSKRNLKYKYAIHEVIQEENNVNVIVPQNIAYVCDVQSDKLSVRTADRKQQDLLMLQQEIDTNPSDPRPYYYMAQTYSGIENFEKAYEWFLNRINHPTSGFQQEKHEACLEAARIAQFVLKRDATEYLKLYEMAIAVDDERPDALYFMGAYYLTCDVPDKQKAFDYLKRGFALGYPEHRQYCLKPSITYNHIPKLLANCCYDMNEYLIGESACELYLKHNTHENEPAMHPTIVSWGKIFALLNHMNTYTNGDDAVSTTTTTPIIYPARPCCCFIAPCGLYNWTGSDILTSGMGGSESMIVELASNLHRQGNFHVVVFCNCLKEETFNDVRYIPISHMFGILNTHFIHTCIISRYSEYLPVITKSNVENIFLMAHDVAFSGNVITINQKLKGVICLSPWHADHIAAQYPELKPLIRLIGHGIDISQLQPTKKDPYKFIYSSLANRGLYELLLMWPKLVAFNSAVSLHIYSDIGSHYMLETFADLMEKIKELINTMPNIVYHGYVSKQILYDGWKTAGIWLYPTSFQETFCVTALEAAASKTLAITTNLAGLQHTVGSRGVLLDACISIDEAVATVIAVLPTMNELLIDKNYEWALTNTWEIQTNTLTQLLMANKYEYRGIPVFEETMKIMITALNGIKVSRILDVSVYSVGMTLIPIMIHTGATDGVSVLNSGLIGSFNANVRNSGLNITAIEMNADDALIELHVRGDRFNAIYLNTSCSLLDCYVELCLAWKLLYTGGVLIVDNLVDESRMDAMNKFIKRLGLTATVKHSSKKLAAICKHVM